MTSTELRFSKAKSVFKGALAFAACALCVALTYFAFTQHRESVALPMAIAFTIAAWGLVRSTRRFRENGPALACDADELRVSPTFSRAEGIAYRDVERIDCDRADRVSYVGGLLGSHGDALSDSRIGDSVPFGEKVAANAGAAFRWGLQIVYRDAVGERRSLRLFDNDVEGGRAALQKFAEAVRLNMNSERSHS